MAQPNKFSVRTAMAAKVKLRLSIIMVSARYVKICNSPVCFPPYYFKPASRPYKAPEKSFRRDAILGRLNRGDQPFGQVFDPVGFSLSRL